MTTDITTEILEVGRRWALAEQQAELAVLDELAPDDLRLIGPFGFVLDKAQWLAVPAGSARDQVPGVG